ncbi:MAG: HAD family hydrolase [Deltaproteobacteria bacterium]|nr:HAD family hydrolase [Deltaproteobacteria bacterium]
MSPGLRAVTAVVFDLDGTLADTQADIASAMNHVLNHVGLPTHPVVAYRRFVGDGVDAMVERAAGDATGTDVVALKQAFRERYVEHLLDETRPYEGATAMVTALAQRGIALAVLSNKPQAMTARIVERLFSGIAFGAVRGQRVEVPHKPHPAGLLEILEELAVPAEQCVMVGDTAADMGCAVAAGVVPIGVTWGFRDRAELQGAGAQALLDRPAELVELVLGDRQT